jgi:catechol 2,3-dioxygenase-like lactoylglutathione lyase family enzyme
VTLERVDHVGFTVADMDRSVAWYTTFLGAPPTLRKVWDVDYIGDLVGYPGCRMECAFFALPGDGVLELVRFLEPPPATVDMETYNAGNGHLCLLVDDIHAEHERLAPIAAFRSDGPIEIPWGPYAGGWAAYLRDPDGITIQLMQHPPGGPRLTDN